MMKSLKEKIILIATAVLLTVISSCSNVHLIEQPAPASPKVSAEEANEVKNHSLPATETSPQPAKPSQDVYQTKTRPNTPAVQKYCQKIDNTFEKYHWGRSHCDDFTWNHVRNSIKGNPIIWYVFGEQSDDLPKNKINSTLIMCGVHGDEITPVKFCFDIINDLKNRPELIADKQIIVAPIVTPDSFFTGKPSRTNARGVDINRNFPTKDWSAKALHLWKHRYGSDKRRYPGKYALSEQETIFQVNLINRYHPDKIISVHAPLTLLDYDGPAFTNSKGASAKDLLVQMSEHAGKYKISNYPFFPGSLGNWAGNEQRIPTYTLELPNSDWTKTDQYFRQFKTAILYAIEHSLLPTDDSKKKYSLNLKKE